MCKKYSVRGRDGRSRAHVSVVSREMLLPRLVAKWKECREKACRLGAARCCVFPDFGPPDSLILSGERRGCSLFLRGLVSEREKEATCGDPLPHAAPPVPAMPAIGTRRAGPRLPPSRPTATAFPECNPRWCAPSLAPAGVPAGKSQRRSPLLDAPFPGLDVPSPGPGPAPGHRCSGLAPAPARQPPGLCPGPVHQLPELCPGPARQPESTVCQDCQTVSLNLSRFVARKHWPRS